MSFAARNNVPVSVTVGMPGIHTYTSGSGTEVIPSSVNTLVIEIWGGSGPGGFGFVIWGTQYSGGGGGSGGYAKTTITVTGHGGATMTYSVGTAGVFASTNGGQSSVTAGTFSMTTMLAGGGLIGLSSYGTGNSGGPGGSASGGADTDTAGNSGTPGGAGIGTGGYGISGVNGVGSNGGRGGYGSTPGSNGGPGLIVFSYS